MWAVIDESVLHAADYYEVFPREPSLDPSLDIDIDNVVRVEDMSPSLLLDHMIEAGKSGQTELLIVTQPEMIEELSSGSEKLQRVRSCEFQHLEFRACCMGQDSDGLAALRTLLGAARVVAPTDRTVYCPVNVEILAAGAPLPLASPERLGIRRFCGREMFGEPYFTLAVHEDEEHNCTAHGAALSWEDVELFVKRNIMFDSNYCGRTSFPVAAFRTCDDLGPELAYLLPADQEYRGRLRSDP